jgi:hypothetical protein
VHNFATGTTSLVSRFSGGPSPCGVNSGALQVTGDGSTVVFDARTPGPSGCTSSQVFLAPATTANPLTVGAPVLVPSPKAVTESATVTATASVSTPALAGGEWWAGADPGQGQGNPMTVSGSTLTGTVDTGLPVGVHQISVRATDADGRWSQPAGALLTVYDPDGPGLSANGALTPGSSTADPGDTQVGGRVDFGFTVRYRNGATVPDGPLRITVSAPGQPRLRYEAVELTSLWTSGATSHLAGYLSLDGAGRIPFTVVATRGTAGSDDHIRIRLYAQGADPSTAAPVHQYSGDLLHGGIRLA